MTSGGEGPGLGGYPDLAKPEVRVTQAYRMLWQQLLVGNKRKARTAYQALNGVRREIGRGRR